MLGEAHDEEAPPPRPAPRPATSLILVAVSTFLLLGNRCGLLGQLLTAALAKLLGVPGTVLLECTLLAVAFVLAFPGRVGKLLAATHRRGRAEPPMETDLTPIERKRLDTVREALKQLGLRPAEYESVIATMDPTQSPDTLIRQALKQLKAGQNALRH